MMGAERASDAVRDVDSGMTGCCRQLTLDFCQGKQLVGDFKGGQISSDTGLLAVRELGQKLGWLAEAVSVVGDPRRPHRTEWDIPAGITDSVGRLEDECSSRPSGA